MYHCSGCLFSSISNLKKILLFSFFIFLPIVPLKAEKVDRVTVDFSADEGKVTYRASGYHHGIGPSRPADELVKPVKPQLIRTYDSLFIPRAKRLGITVHFQCTNDEAVMKGLYEGDWSDWENHIEKKARAAAGNNHVYMCFFNEPYVKLFRDIDRPWSAYFEVYHRAYNKVKEVDSSLKVVGPSTSPHARPGTGRFREFLEYCRENDCVPNVVSWHNEDFPGFEEEIKLAYKIKDELKLNIEGFSVNEYAIKTRNPRPCPPGLFARYCAVLEKWKIINASIASHMNENLACAVTEDEPQMPRSLWWALKGYADITGHLVKVKPSGEYNQGMDGVAGWNPHSYTARLLLGCGRESLNDVKVEFINLPEGLSFRKIMVHVERIPYTGWDKLSYPKEEIHDVLTVNDNFTITLDDIEPFEAYTISISPFIDKYPESKRKSGFPFIED